MQGKRKSIAKREKKSKRPKGKVKRMKRTDESKEGQGPKRGKFKEK